MAGTTIRASVTGMSGSASEALRLQHNKVIIDLQAIKTAAATSLAAIAAVTLTAAAVADNNGNTT